MMQNKKYKIPTGYLLVNEYSKGQLETLSIGDYGKEHNIKADFLDFKKEIHGVVNGPYKRLSEKWVITLSTQYGCPMKCKFCDVPSIPFKGNATFDDLKNQFYDAISVFPETKYTDRLNLHFARMGEPIFNNNVFLFSNWLAENKLAIYKETGLRIETLHPVLTTSLPKKFKYLESKLLEWCEIKNKKFNGQAGLQLSINSTNSIQRNDMFDSMSLGLEEISEIASRLPIPLGRKYCLNFAYSSDFEIDAEKLRTLFDPEYWMVKITPIHNNESCTNNNYKTVDGYKSWDPYSEVEKNLKDVGFDVLVFVPSQDEEDSLVTCGNAILSGRELKVLT
jgi:23S rRNA (adenine2503-C2)-methyltransferase